MKGFFLFLFTVACVLSYPRCCRSDSLSSIHTCQAAWIFPIGVSITLLACSLSLLPCFDTFLSLALRTPRHNTCTDFSGSTVVTDEYVRLTPDRQVRCAVHHYHIILIARSAVSQRHSLESDPVSPRRRQKVSRVPNRHPLQGSWPRYNHTIICG